MTVKVNPICLPRQQLGFAFEGGMKVLSSNLCQLALAASRAYSVNEFGHFGPPVFGTEFPKDSLSTHVEQCPVGTVDQR